ncbi:MAG: hypothetical protein FP820_04620 [Sulfurimonas sp.]|jgi:hypothetical protein|nr:hypothetical protein [Sulfurimonas sp.]MBU1215981.1 hypothetical protein [bacterium]MBU1435660.1 hypothetical protein [bacterium]MBU1502416.1 hypothetical protein [bacterium]MBU3939324.1 hypothetical protein [bacterium]
MTLSFRIKQFFYNAFRELFVYHHSSLEFRAKIFALVISADENAKIENYIIVKNAGLKIYDNDEDRANLLMLNTKEFVKKIRENDGLHSERLINNIQKELKMVPRYAKKINTDDLQPLLMLPYDNDTIAYQKNIIEFLENIKEDILHEKREQIAKDEEKLK